MRKLIYLLFSLLFILGACDDGDIITLELDFDKNLSRCGDENSESYVVYDTKSDPFESLTFLFTSNSASDEIFDPEETPHEALFTINGISTRFNYRTYDGDPSGLICEDIPSSDVNITEDYEASTGSVQSISTFIDDDNDNIPSELEDLNQNGDLEDDDSDGDGIPNYKDNDDDNDNVLTKDENPDPDGDGDLADAQNTDGIDLPDYLDTDDDNDGVMTRHEDENLNGNLFDDFEAGATSPRFLDITATIEYVNNNLNTNTFIRTVTVQFTVINVDLEILSSDFIELGTYVHEIEF